MKGGKVTLSPELIRSLDLFIREHYFPEMQGEKSGAGHDSEILWKGLKESDLGEPSFQGERITLKDGEPVLLHGSSAEPESLQDAVDHIGETFQQHLFRLIDERGLTDAEVYKRAHIDRKLFSKIRSNENYIPRKKNVIALALALRLDRDEAEDFFRRAGIALSPGSRFDVIIEYCIRNKLYDIDIVNELLNQYGEEILGNQKKQST